MDVVRVKELRDSGMGGSAMGMQAITNTLGSRPVYASRWGQSFLGLGSPPFGEHWSRWIKAAAKKRMTLRKVSTGSETSNIGDFAGVSGHTVDKNRDVAEAAESDPERFGHLVEEME